MYPNKYITELVKDVLKVKEKTIHFYENLAEDVSDIDDKEKLRQICLDENKHYNMLKDMYNKMADNSYEPDNLKEENSEKDNVLNRIAAAIDKELESVEVFRPILFALENPLFKNYLQEIITDEQNHAARLNFMYSKNK